MSNVEIGDMWTTTTGPEHPAEIVTGIEGEHARFASGGFWRVDRLTSALGWRRIVPAREAAYEKRITYLQDQLEATARSGVENAARYAADLEAVRRDKTAAVERIRAALLKGATDEAQTEGARIALIMAEHGTYTVPHARRLAAAYLAQGQALAEARALLSDIGTRALALLGKAPT